MNVFELFKESYGVGVVASKNQTKDPRYSHSLTVDVKPDTSKKNRKALGLSEAQREDGSFASRDEFYKNMYPMALKAVSKLGLQIPPELLITQWGFESGWGSKVSGDNNFFGIKADKGYEGDSKEVATSEYEDGEKVNIKDKFRSYDNVDDAVDDYVDFIKSNPRYTKAGVFDAKNSEEYMAALQKAGYATDPAYTDKILKQEAITKKQIAKVVPPEEQEKLKAEQPTVSTTPGAAKAEPEYDAFGNVVTAKGFDPDNKKAQQAANSVARQARRDDAVNAELGGADSAGATQSTGSAYRIKPGDTLRTIAKNNGTTVDALMKANPQIKDANSINAGAKLNLATPAGNAEEESYADKGKAELPDSLSVKQRELDDAQAGLEALTLNGTQEEVAKAQADVDRLTNHVKSNKDMQAGGLEGPASFTSDQAEYAKAKEGALLQGNDDVTSIADDDLKRRRAEAYANQQEKMGNTEIADAARAEAKRHEALRNEKLTKGITFGQGSLEQQEQQMKQWDKTKAEGGDPTQSWKGGVITDPNKLKDWQKRNTEADEKQKEQGNYTVTKDIDTLKKEVEPTVEPKVDMSTAGQAGTDDFMKSGPGTTPEKPVISTAPTEPEADDISKDFPATPKVDPYPNPGYTGEELRIYNQLSDGQKAKITTDFEKSKNNTAQQRKNITPRTGPTSIPDAKPRSLLDIKHQQTLSNIEGGKVLVDPAQAREVSKALGMRNLNSTEQKARDAAIEKLRYTAPSVQDTQKVPAPIVDKSTQYQSDRNANAYDGKIGDASGVLSRTNATVPAATTTAPRSAVGQATIGSTQTVKPGAQFSPRGGPIATVGVPDQQRAQQQADADARKAQQEAQKAEATAKQEAQKAEQQAKQEAQKAEQERKRQQQAQQRPVVTTGSTFQNGKPVRFSPSGGIAGESAIFRAINK